jgi:radical SAM superfamily enzyme YgiQ (UPF0313 family)
MKITLISTSPDVQCYGIRTISACLKKDGHDVDLIFLQKSGNLEKELIKFKEKKINYYIKPYADKTMDDLVELTKESDLVGITIMSNNWDEGIQITKKIKENNNIPVAWGGIHPTIRPDECLDHADMVCIGEGEESFSELARKMEMGQHYHDTKGMGFKVNGKKINNGHRALPGTKGSKYTSLDQIPFQDYDYKTHYIMRDNDIVKMNLELITQNRFLEFYQTQPTRGCPFGCTYCINNTYLQMYPHQKPIRMRGVDNIIKELQEVKRNLPFAKIILFDDDAFFIMPLEIIREFGKKYKELIRMPLAITGAAPSTLTREKFAILVDAGLVSIRMGIETAAKKTKKFYKRPASNIQVLKAGRMLGEYSYYTKIFYNLILDCPWETDEDSVETLMLMSKIPTPYQLWVTSLTLYPATGVYRRAIKDGLITGKDDINDIYRKHILHIKETYLNSLFLLLQDYALVGVGISPIVMYFLTHKITRKLHLHWFLYTIVKKSFPFFRKLSRLIRPSTRMYKTGFDSITQEPDYYEKVIETKLATRPTHLRPIGLSPTPVQVPVPGEAWTNQSLRN